MKLKIIYVEDNIVDYEMVKAILEESGIIDVIYRVGNKKELLQILKDDHYDIVLSNYDNSHFHGLEVIKLLAEKFPDLPLIIVTANLSDEIAVDLIQKGAWDYVLKENIYRLIPSINSTIDRKKIIQEKESALLAIKESETNYRVLAESSPYGIVVHSHGKIIYHNKAAHKIVFADGEGELLGGDLFNHMHPESEEIGKKRIQQLYEGKSLNEAFEIKYINLENKVLYLEVAASAIQFKGKPAAQVIFKDVNERKAAELELINAKNKAEESDRLKSSFLENMSHEIRTPLNGILGFTKLLKNNNLSDKDKKSYLEIIDDSGQHLLTIINDIIEVSQIETGQVEMKNENFNLNLLLEEVFSFYNDGENYKELPILLSFIPGQKNEDVNIFADKARLKQVFYNLLSNAFKFTHEGEIEFGYSVESKGNIRFYFRDTGIGISEKNKTFIFDRFRQADVSSTRAYGGNGLGLTISKGIIESMSGKIWLESIENQGTTFYFEIPYIKSTTSPVEDGKVKKSSYHRDWIGKRFLIAEDEQTNFTLLKHILTKAGAEVEHAKTGREVIELIEKGKYDLLLLDIKMPVMDGFEVIKYLRNSNIDIPVIAQTAYAMTEDAEKVMSSGCDDYITKPIRAKDLLSKIDNLI